MIRRELHPNAHHQAHFLLRRNDSHCRPTCWTRECPYGGPSSHHGLHQPRDPGMSVFTAISSITRQRDDGENPISMTPPSENDACRGADPRKRSMLHLLRKDVAPVDSLAAAPFVLGAIGAVRMQITGCPFAYLSLHTLPGVGAIFLVRNQLYLIVVLYLVP